MSNLTLEKKAELFDYLAKHASELKMSVGRCSDWLYNDSRLKSPEKFASMLESFMIHEAFIEMMNETDKDEEE